MALAVSSAAIVSAPIVPSIDSVFKKQLLPELQKLTKMSRDHTLDFRIQVADVISRTHELISKYSSSYSELIRFGQELGTLQGRVVIWGSKEYADFEKILSNATTLRTFNEQMALLNQSESKEATSVLNPESAIDLFLNLIPHSSLVTLDTSEKRYRLIVNMISAYEETKERLCQWESSKSLRVFMDLFFQCYVYDFGPNCRHNDFKPMFKAIMEMEPSIFSGNFLVKMVHHGLFENDIPELMVSPKKTLSLVKVKEFIWLYIDPKGVEKCHNLRHLFNFLGTLMHGNVEGPKGLTYLYYSIMESRENREKAMALLLNIRELGILDELKEDNEEMWKELNAELLGLTEYVDFNEAVKLRIQAQLRNPDDRKL